MAGIEDKIGPRIRQLRRRANLSQAELAKASRLAVETISRYERGALTPGLSSLEAMAKAMRIPLTSFFAEGQKKPDLPPDILKIVNRLKDEEASTIRRAYRVIAAMLS